MCTNSFFLDNLGNNILSFKRDHKNLYAFVEHLFERIQLFDPIIKSYTCLNSELSRECKQVGKYTLFSGLPFAVKDLIDTRGIITTYGSPFFKDHIPEMDAKIISIIKKNGGTIIGKTNTHQFALGIVTPPTKNPWDLSRIPGGSSGGSAAAVASGLSILSLGTDTGGSIRLPAAMCGVTGLKPSHGKIPINGVFPESFSEDHVGPICRYASDLRLVLNGMGMEDLLIKQKKIFNVGIITQFFEESEKSIKATVMKSVDRLVSEGIINETREYEIPNLNEIRMCHEIIDKAETNFHHSKEFLRRRLQYPYDVQEEIDAGLNIIAKEYIYALQSKHRFKEQFKNSMKGLDILISPTVSKISPTIDEASKMELKDHYTYTKFLTPFNYLGTPSLTMPCGFVDRLPVGFQTIARYGYDTYVIDLGIQYQNLSDWHKKIPQKFQ